MPQLTKPYNNFFETGVLYGDPAQSTNISPNPDFGPFQQSVPDPGEFSINAYIPTTLSNAVKNASRLFDSNKTIVDQGDSAPAWYNVPARVSGAVSGINDALQSTLIKVIVLVAIVGVVAMFGMSYVQAKGANLAK